MAVFLNKTAVYKWREDVLVNAKQTQHGCCGLNEMKLARLGVIIYVYFRGR
jgi:hypothetical protein